MPAAKPIVAVVVLCIALINAAYAWSFDVECASNDPRGCPMFPYAASCSQGKCLVSSASIGSVSTVHAVDESSVASKSGKWSSVTRKSDYPELITEMCSSPAGSGVFAAGIGSDDDRDSVLFSQGPSGPFTPVRGTTGPIALLAPIPNEDGDKDDVVGALYIRVTLSGYFETGVHLISPSGTLEKTIPITSLGSFTPTDFAFATRMTWFGTAITTNKNSLIIRTDDAGAAWSSEIPIYNDESVFRHIECTTTVCVAVACGGKTTYVVHGKIAQRMEWVVEELPLADLPFDVHRLAINQDASKILIAGKFSTEVPFPGGQALFMERSETGGSTFKSIFSPVADVYSGATFLSNGTGLVMGSNAAGTRSVYTLVDSDN